MKESIESSRLLLRNHLKQLARQQLLPSNLKSLFKVALQNFKLYLFNWKQKSFPPYQYFVSGENLCIVASDIHSRELLSQFPNDKWTKYSVPHLTFGQIFRAKSQMVLFSLVNLYPASVSRPEQLPMLSVLSFAYNGYYFLYYRLRLLIFLAEHSEINNIICFEFGHVGYAVNSVTQELGLRSTFIQHGLLDNFVVPVVFDHLYLWGQWDIDYFSHHGLDYSRAKIFLKFPYHKISTSRDSHLDKVVFFALEYPTQMCSATTLTNYIGELIAAISPTGWRLVVRFHPRTILSLQKKWRKKFQAHCLFDENFSTDVEESFKQHGGYVFVTLNSSAILKVRSIGGITAYIDNPLAPYVIAPFRQFPEFFHKLARPRDIVDLLNNLDC